MEILNKLTESLLGDGSPKDIWFYIAQAVGLAAVTFYLLGYLQKKRGTILTFNLTARVLYVLQYVLLGAFEGSELAALTEAYE
ncbi:MAG: YgjV family protein [Clostridia bacterium]|nr:YgjV family protein [Clostridia bacterium]